MQKATKLTQVNSNRSEWKNFINTIERLGYNEGKDFKLSTKGNPLGLLTESTLKNPLVQKAMRTYQISNLEESKSEKLHSPNFLNEGDSVFLVRKEDRNIKGIILESKLGMGDTIKVKLEDGRVVARGLHEVKLIPTEKQVIVESTKPLYNSDRKKVIYGQLNEMTDINEVIKEAVNLTENFSENDSEFFSFKEWKNALMQNFSGVTFKEGSNNTVLASNGQEIIGEWSDFKQEGVIYGEIETLTEDEENTPLGSIKHVRRDGEITSLGNLKHVDGEIDDWDTVERNAKKEAFLSGVEDDFEGEANLDFSAFSDEQLCEFATEFGLENCQILERAEIENELNNSTLDQNDVQEYIEERGISNSLEENIINTLKEDVKFDDFPFDSTIDFRYYDDNMCFDSQTPEYEALNSLGEEEWQEYLDAMAHAGITVEYDSIEDQYCVNSSFAEEEIQDETDTFPISEADCKTMNNLVEANGAKLLEVKGMPKYTNKKDKYQLIVESLNNKKTILYDDSDNVSKPWSIGINQFKTINEAIKSIPYKAKEEQVKQEIKESIIQSKKQQNLQKYNKITDPILLSESEKQRRKQRSQDLLDRFLDDDLSNRSLFGN